MKKQLSQFGSELIFDVSFGTLQPYLLMAKPNSES